MPDVYKRQGLLPTIGLIINAPEYLNNKPKINIYPNPAYTNSTIYIDAPFIDYWELYDVNGKFITKSKDHSFNINQPCLLYTSFVSHNLVSMLSMCSGNVFS